MVSQDATGPGRDDLGAVVGASGADRAPPVDPSAAARRIAHVDMDAFYASVELLRRPDLVGRPVAIGGRGDPQSRAVVTTATYAARAFGIRSGIPLRQAAQLCPSCVFLPVDFPAYREYSRRFKRAIATVASRIEDRGIDEVYVDLTDVDGEAAGLARRIKQAITAETGLSCSVGIAPNKLLAKIASDLDKPDGLTLVGMDDVPTRIWPLPVGRVNGIGPKAVARLAAMGIERIGELAEADPARLQAQFGMQYARWLLLAARGIDDRPLALGGDPQSRSRETTFDRDLVPGRNDDEIREVIGEMSIRVAADLARGNHAARTIGLKIRFSDFTTVTRDLSLSRPTAAALDIERAAVACLGRIRMTRPVRLLGVKASGIEAASPQTPQLF